MLVGADGKIQRVNGRVVEAKHENGSEFPISLWMAPVEDHDELRFMAVMEPVARITAVFGIAADNTIVWCEQSLIDLCALSLDEVSHLPSPCYAAERESPSFWVVVVVWGRGGWSM
jgi:hypothetical protein